MSDSLSSAPTDAINRSITLAPVVAPEELGSSLHEAFEIKDTAAELNRHDLRRVSRMAKL